MSIIQSGKTFRKIPHFVRQDPLLTINCKSHERDYVELFDQNYYNNVSYSMKKKNRWMLATLLTKEFYDQDDVMIYTEHQSLFGDKPNNTIYLYDSLSQREFGCPDINSDKLMGKSINDKSLIHSIENEHHHTKQELKKFENLKNRKNIKTKKSRKHHRPYIQNSVDSLISREDYLSNVENRKNSVYVVTSIHINDKSKVNFMKKLCEKDYKTSKCNIKETKFMRKRLLKGTILMDEEEFLDEDLDEEFENGEIVDEYNCDENVAENSKKEFVLVEDDFICKNLNNTKIKVKHKGKQCKIPIENSLKKLIVITDESDEKSELFIDLKRDVLPFIEIDIPIKSFLDDLDIILEIAQCWYSNTLNKSILIDLSNLLGGNTEDFLLLKPKFFKENIISLKIIFNLINFNFNDVLLDKNFEKVTEIIQILHTNAQPIKNESTISRKVMTLDEPNECLDGIWKTKILENHEKIHLYHDEWRKYILNYDIIEKIVSGISETPTYLIETCEICFNEICESEMVIINGCQHKICEECLSSHLICRLETGMKILNCPGTDCKSEIDCVTILQCISGKRYRKRIGMLEATVLQKMGISCIECGTITIMNYGNSIEPRRLDYKCNCGRIICNLCGRNQHWPSSCYEFRKHIEKLKSLRDVNLFTEYRPPLIFEGINCPKCLCFVVKSVGCNHMSCYCGAHFCWLCGDSNEEGIHLTNGFPCYKPYNNHLTFDLTYVRPGPSEFRSKLYVLSLDQKANNSEYSRRKLFYQLYLAFNSKSKFELPPYNIKQLEHQFKQLINITENVFVKAYQLDKRKHVRLKKYLKAVASMLIYYQSQIKIHIETISYMVKYSKKTNRLINQIKEIWIKLNESLSDAKQYINHMHLILRN